MITLYTDQPSIVGNPMVLYSATCEAIREGTSLHCAVTVSAHFAAENTQIGVGRGIDIIIDDIIMPLKEVNEIWQYPAVKSKTINITFDNIGDAVQISFVITTLRTDAIGAPGVHYKLVTLPVPDPILPNPPGIALSDITGDIRNPVVVTAINNGTGSGTAAAFVFQYKKEGDTYWTTFASSSDITANFTPVKYGASKNSIYRFRVLLYNSVGGTSTSEVSERFICTFVLDAPTMAMISPTQVNTPDDTVLLYIAYPIEAEVPTYFIIYRNGLQWRTTTEYNYTFTAAEIGLNFNTSVTISVAAYHAKTDTVSAQTAGILLKVLPDALRIPSAFIPEKAGVYDVIDIVWFDLSEAGSYTVEIAYRAPFGEWSDWQTYATFEYNGFSIRLADIATFVVNPGGLLQFRIKPVPADPEALTKTEWTETNICEITGADAYISINGVWKICTAYVIINGEWQSVNEISAAGGL